MLKILSIRCCADKLLIGTELLLSTCMAQLTLSVHLMIEIQLNKVFLLLRLLKALLDLNKGLLWSEVRLIIERLNSFLSLHLCLLLFNLVAKELTIGSVLVLPVLCLYVLHAIHVVHG